MTCNIYDTLINKISFLTYNFLSLRTLISSNIPPDKYIALYPSLFRKNQTFLAKNSF